MPAELLKNAAVASQLLLVGTGIVLLWRTQLSPAARAVRPPPALAPWDGSAIEGVRFILHGIAAGFLASFLVGLLGKPLGWQGDGLTIAATAALHGGALLGFTLYFVFQRVPTTELRGENLRSGLVTGVATFVMAMPLVFAINLAWLGLLKLAGIAVARQNAVELVGRLAGTAWFFVFVASAVILAPAAEELLFRGGLFRVLRGRLPRWFAFVVPSLFFAAIHFHVPSFVPLAALGLIFSFAYERTGRIVTPIVAHALFNFNNLLMVLAGADQ
jgi:hypothetical protein